MNELTPKIRPVVPQSLKGNVLSQIKKRKKRMKDIRNYSAVAAVVAAFIYFPLVMGNGTQAQAMDLIEQSISKVDEVKTMVFTYSMRNPFTYNPDVIDMREKMNKMTGEIIFEQPQVWKFESKNKWYIFDGEKTYWHSYSYDDCLVNMKVDFSDLGLFNAMFLKPTSLMETVLKVAKDKDTKIDIHSKGDSVTLIFNSKVRSIDKYRFMIGDLFGWYNNKLKGSFVTNCRHIYVFDSKTKLLRSFKISVFNKDKFITILKSEKIDYNVVLDKNKIIDKQKNIKKRLLQEYKYLVNMTSKQAVEKILTAIKNNNAANLNINLPIEREEYFKNWYGMEILEIGEPYKKDNYVGEIIPCKIKIKSGEIVNATMAVRNDNEFKIWMLDNENLIFLK